MRGVGAFKALEVPLEVPLLAVVLAPSVGVAVLYLLGRGVETDTVLPGRFGAQPGVAVFQETMQFQGT